MQLRTKLVAIGIVVTLIPLLIILIAVFNQNRQAALVGERESLQLAYADLGHIVDNLYTLAESHQEVTHKNIDAALKVAREQIDRAGRVAVAAETISWKATNQTSNQVQEIKPAQTDGRRPVARPGY